MTVTSAGFGSPDTSSGEVRRKFPFVLMSIGKPGRSPGVTFPAIAAA
jgi:hypothetical protein